MIANNQNRALIIFSGLIVAVLVILVWHDRTPKTAPGESTVPLPSLGSGSIKLRVAHVVNPRFPALSQKQQAEVLAKTRVLVKQNFHLNVEFSRPEELGIKDFFALRNKSIDTNLETRIVDTHSLSAADRDEMRASIYKTLSQYKDENNNIVDYARPYLTHPFVGDDLHQLSDALVSTLLTRLNYWRTQNAADGAPVLDGSPYNQWVWWDSIGYGHVPFDVVITNQLVASVETYDMDVHSSLRGGITAGTTSFNNQGKFKAYSFVTSFPMLNDNPVLSQLRGDGHYSETQITDYVAAVLAHELGHLLLHLSHPFGRQACIMSPTPLLRFHSWYDHLDPAQCPLNSSPEMTPGAATLDYRADWVAP